MCACGKVKMAQEYGSIVNIDTEVDQQLKRLFNTAFWLHGRNPLYASKREELAPVPAAVAAASAASASASALSLGLTLEDEDNSMSKSAGYGNSESVLPFDITMSRLMFSWNAKSIGLSQRSSLTTSAFTPSPYKSKDGSEQENQGLQHPYTTLQIELDMDDKEMLEMLYSYACSSKGDVKIPEKHDKEAWEIYEKFISLNNSNSSSSGNHLRAVANAQVSSSLINEVITAHKFKEVEIHMALEPKEDIPAPMTPSTTRESSFRMGIHSSLVVGTPLTQPQSLPLQLQSQNSFSQTPVRSRASLIFGEAFHYGNDDRKDRNSSTTPLLSKSRGSTRASRQLFAEDGSSNIGIDTIITPGATSPESSPMAIVNAKNFEWENKGPDSVASKKKGPLSASEKKKENMIMEIMTIMKSRMKMMEDNNKWELQWVSLGWRNLVQMLHESQSKEKETQRQRYEMLSEAIRSKLSQNNENKLRKIEVTFNTEEYYKQWIMELYYHYVEAKLTRKIAEIRQWESVQLLSKKRQKQKQKADTKTQKSKKKLASKPKQQQQQQSKSKQKPNSNRAVEDEFELVKSPKSPTTKTNFGVGTTNANVTKEDQSADTTGVSGNMSGSDSDSYNESDNDDDGSDIELEKRDVLQDDFGNDTIDRLIAQVTQTISKVTLRDISRDFNICVRLRFRDRLEVEMNELTQKQSSSNLQKDAQSQNSAFSFPSKYPATNANVNININVNSNSNNNSNNNNSDANINTNTTSANANANTNEKKGGKTNSDALRDIKKAVPSPGRLKSPLKDRVRAASPASNKPPNKPEDKQDREEEKLRRSSIITSQSKFTEPFAVHMTRLPAPQALNHDPADVVSGILLILDNDSLQFVDTWNRNVSTCLSWTLPTDLTHSNLLMAYVQHRHAALPEPTLRSMPQDNAAASSGSQLSNPSDPTSTAAAVEGQKEGQGNSTGAGTAASKMTSPKQEPIVVSDGVLKQRLVEASMTRHGKLSVIRFGGRNLRGQPMANVDLFDMSSGWWISLKELSSPRDSVQASILRGRIIISGGHIGNNKAVAVVEAYSFSKWTWVPLPSMKYARFGHAMCLCSHEQQLFVGGGDMGDSNYTNSCEIYDSEANEWMLVSPMLYRRFGSSACEWTGRNQVVVAGGICEEDEMEEKVPVDTEVSIAEVYDVETDTWAELPEMNFDHGLFPAIWCDKRDNYIYVASQ
ncbi:intracisternal A particle-promoted polypeptide, partial [Reticulomyxa filosa]